MAGRGKKLTGPRGLCAYLAEVKETDGITTVPDEISHLVRKCIEDKIFSESSDEIVVCRSDTTTESSRIKFVAANWDGLRKGLEPLTSENSCEAVGIVNPINCLNSIVKAIVKQSKEDSYESKKILFFASLASYILDEDELKKLGDNLLQNNIYLSIVLPNKSQMENDLQIQNSKLVEKVLSNDKYEEASMVMNFRQAERQILNTTSDKVKKPSPWNCPMEISPDVIFNVQGFVCTRKNKVGEMTRVLLKQCEPEIKSAGASSSASSSMRAIAANSSDTTVALQSAAAAEKMDTEEDKTVVVEVAKQVLSKQQIWTENDGNEVAAEDIGKGYWFGDKLIPYNELESEDAYTSGEKCFKLLVFLPPEKINPSFHTGDGTTLFYPKKGDVRAEVIFKALYKSMLSLNKIALMRKVYRKDTRAQIGVLAPDTERKCLVFTEICFTDDVSIPQFPLLVKQEDLVSDENVGTDKKEELIDKLIESKSLDNFCPEEGPADPAVVALREEIARKILRDKPQADKAKTDTIGIYFQKALNHSKSRETLEQIRSCFPLTENMAKDERFAGSKIFKKRQNEEPLALEAVEEKKPKLEVSVKNEAEEAAENGDDGTNELLDEL